MLLADEHRWCCLQLYETYNRFKAVFFIEMHILHSFSMGDSQNFKTDGASMKWKECLVFRELC